MFGGGDSNEAEEARKAEQERQAKIRQGTSRINTIFDGGTLSTGAVDTGSAFDPEASYFTASGDLWKPVFDDTPSTTTPTTGTQPQSRTGVSGLRGMFDVSGGGGGGGGGATPGEGGRGSFMPSGSSGPKTPAEQFAEMVKQGKLFTGTETTQGFDDDFFAGRRQSFLDYANPQLQDQYGDAQKELTFSLARSGMLDSSVRGEKAGELQKLFDLREQEIRDQALSFENQSRNAVEDARSDLIAMLNATGDAQGATNSALTRAQLLTQPQSYSPLGQLFVDFTSGLGTQAARERAEAMSGRNYAQYDTGLFGRPGRVTVS